MTTILNLGAGQEIPEIFRVEEPPLFMVSVDKIFYTFDIPSTVEKNYEHFLNRRGILNEKLHYRINSDIFDFLSRTIMKFDIVIMHRVLEHISFTQVNYFFYLLSIVMEKVRKLPL
jgi:hypothetical protein